MMDDQRKPFKQWKEDGLIVRDFHRNADWWLFKWHADECDRIIWATNKNDWQFQFEGEDSFPLRKGMEVEIPMGIVHRVIPGKSKLQIKIMEFK
jgi:hypothetical protein